MRISIVTPAAPGSRTGNRITALRWARILRLLGQQVVVRQQYRRARCDVLIALHAGRSADSIERFHDRCPDAPLLVALTGTDLYADLHRDPRVMASMQRATRLIVLQPLALSELPVQLRRKARVVFQSCRPPRNRSKPAMDGRFEVCVLGHLRPVKDPMLAASASRLLPKTSKIRILHIGGALDPASGEQARCEEQANPRYRWLGELSHASAMRLLARASLLAHTSQMEGGANAVMEALALGVPVVTTDINGSTGILGTGYPGLFPPGDAEALAALLGRAETDSEFYRRIKLHCQRLASLAEPARELRAWQKLLAEIEKDPTSTAEHREPAANALADRAELGGQAGRRTRETVSSG